MRALLTPEYVGVRNVGAEEHAFTLLQNDVIHEIGAPAANVAGKIAGDAGEEVAQKRFLLLGT